jgi:hypothetical protein
MQLGSANLPGAIDVIPTVQPDTRALDRSSATRFGEDIRLLGHVVSAQGDALQVTFYWQALRSPSADYQVFLHLVDGAGQPVSQADGPPLLGLYPTSRWQTGQVISDTHTIPWPPGARPVSVLVGLYDLSSLQRLAARGDDGQPRAEDATTVPVPGP